MITEKQKTLRQLEELVGGKRHKEFTPQVEALVGSSDAYALLFQESDVQRLYKDVVNEDAAFQEWQRQASPGDEFYGIFLDMATDKLAHLLQTAEESGPVAAYRCVPTPAEVKTDAEYRSRERPKTVGDLNEMMQKSGSQAEYAVAYELGVNQGIFTTVVVSRTGNEMKEFRKRVEELEE